MFPPLSCSLWNPSSSEREWACRAPHSDFQTISSIHLSKATPPVKCMLSDSILQPFLLRACISVGRLLSVSLLPDSHCAGIQPTLNSVPRLPPSLPSILPSPTSQLPTPRDTKPVINIMYYCTAPYLNLRNPTLWPPVTASPGHILWYTGSCSPVRCTNPLTSAYSTV